MASWDFLRLNDPLVTWIHLIFLLKSKPRTKIKLFIIRIIKNQVKKQNIHDTDIINEWCNSTSTKAKSHFSTARSEQGLVFRIPKKLSKRRHLMSEI